MLIHVIPFFLQGLRVFGKNTAADLISGFQNGHCLPDLFHHLFTLALDQALAQNVQFTLGLRLLGGGQEHFGLDEHQVGRHGDKLAGDLHIQPLHLVQISKILFQNGGDGHILDLDLIFAQKQENNIQRALKIFHFLGAGMDDALQAVLRLTHTASYKQTFGHYTIFSLPAQGLA